MGYGNRVQSQLFTENDGLPVLYSDWESLAKSKLEKNHYDFIAGHAGTGETYKSNREALMQWKIKPRILRAIENRDLSIELFGEKYFSPVLLAPVGVQTLANEVGELGSAKVAAEMGIPFIVSTNASHSLEEVANVMGEAPRWFQLYCNGDDNVTLSMLRRARNKGYSAIVVTLDSPIYGWRTRDLANGYLPFKDGTGLANFFSDPVFCADLEKSPSEDKEAAIEKYFNMGVKNVTWEDIALIKDNTDLPILLKGILNPEDARLALEHGADGIIVSNHGARQIDGAIGTMDALEQIYEVVQGRIPVLMDSGIRSGADVIKALALGASAVLLGRPYIYGLASAGEKGVKRVLDNLLAELDITLALTGYQSISNLDRSILYRSKVEIGSFK